MEDETKGNEIKYSNDAKSSKKKCLFKREKQEKKISKSCKKSLLSRKSRRNLLVVGGILLGAIGIVTYFIFYQPFFGGSIAPIPPCQEGYECPETDNPPPETDDEFKKAYKEWWDDFNSYYYTFVAVFVALLVYGEISKKD